MVLTKTQQEFVTISVKIKAQKKFKHEYFGKTKIKIANESALDLANHYSDLGLTVYSDFSELKKEGVKFLSNRYSKPSMFIPTFIWLWILEAVVVWLIKYIFKEAFMSEKDLQIVLYSYLIPKE